MCVYSDNYNLAHGFVHESSESGRNSNGSFNFDKNVICSYSTAIGRRVIYKSKKSKAERTVYLLNTEKYSVTTSAHQTLLANAVYGTVIKVCDSDSLSDCKKGILSYLVRLEYLFGKFNKSRSAKLRVHEEILSLSSDIKRYLFLFESEIDKRSLPKIFKKILRDESIFDGNFEEQLAKYKKSKSKAEFKAIEKEEKLEQERLKKEISDFLSYEINSIKLSHEEIKLRVSKNGLYIETSGGVVIRLKQALAFFKECILIKAGELVRPTIEQVEDFIVDSNSVDEEGNARVGCHYMTFEEMNRVYKSLVDEPVLNRLSA